MQTLLERSFFPQWPLALSEDHHGEDWKTKSGAAPVLYQKHAEQIRMPVIVQVIPDLRNKDERQLLSALRVHQDWFPDLQHNTS